MKITLHSNCKELLDAFELLEKRAKNEIAIDALNAGADVGLEYQYGECPVGETGNLRQSLGKSEVKGKGLNAEIKFGIQDTKDREYIYGYYQEHGTEVMAGKHWMSKAFNKSEAKIREAIKEKIIEGLTKK